MNLDEGAEEFGDFFHGSIAGVTGTASVGIGAFGQELNIFFLYNFFKIFRNTNICC